jgi:NADPH:quinone reductase-like Zn-dependent oxidoreductase
MKAVVCSKYGPPEVLQLREVEKPVPRDDQLLIRIHATTVTAGDAIMRNLRFPLNLVFRLAFGAGRGKILGHELSGEVEAVGKDVRRFRAGDQVFASTGTAGGAYAEYICLPEDGFIAVRPANLTYEEAAAVPVGGNTALYLLKQGEIRSGQKVLIYGASGSVGTYAVQLARHFGGEVTGVCSTANLEMVRSLGASRVIDYTREDFSETGERYDVIFDAVRKTSEAHSRRALKENGRFLTVKSGTKSDPENLILLKELIEAGEVKPVIDRHYPLEQIVEAHRYVDQGHKKGNVVITL